MVGAGGGGSVGGVPLMSVETSAAMVRITVGICEISTRLDGFDIYADAMSTTEFAYADVCRSLSRFFVGLASLSRLFMTDP